MPKCYPLLRDFCPFEFSGLIQFNPFKNFFRHRFQGKATFNRVQSKGSVWLQVFAFDKDLVQRGYRHRLEQSGTLSGH